MKMNRQEQGIYNEFMQDLESNTYTREEIVDKKMARAVKFFVVETALKEPLKRAIRKGFSLRDAYN